MWSSEHSVELTVALEHIESNGPQGQQKAYLGVNIYPAAWGTEVFLNV